MIAALILAHHSPELLGRLVRRLEAYEASCFIHLDAGREIGPFQAACSGTSAIFIEPRTKIMWGGFSIVAATLSLLCAALADKRFSRFALISGDTYPIKPGKEFQRMVMQPFEQIQLGVPPANHVVQNRIERTFLPDSGIGALLQRDGDPSIQRFLTEEDVAEFECIRHVFELKKAGFPWRYAKGSQWWILTRPTALRCMEVIATETELINWFRYSSVPDEALFQTILENFGPFDLGRTPPLYALWERWPRPFLFTDSVDLDLLKNAAAPFARKFSMKQGEPILDALDEWMDNGG